MRLAYLNCKVPIQDIYPAEELTDDYKKTGTYSTRRICSRIKFLVLNSNEVVLLFIFTHKWFV